MTDAGSGFPLIDIQYRSVKYTFLRTSTQWLYNSLEFPSLIFNIIDVEVE